MEYSNINLNLYRSFYYVAKYNGFTNASNNELISQSALSSNIIKLEEDLGYKLFIRTKGNLTLTKEGEKLYSKIIDILNILDDNNYKNELNIGTLRFIADNYLIDAIENYNLKLPKIKLNFNIDNNTNLYQLLRSDKLDIVISRYPLFTKFSKNIIVEKLQDVYNVFVCTKDYYEKNLININDEYSYQLILPNNSEKRRMIEQYLIDNNINYNVKIEITNSNLLKSLILKNLGVGYINKDSIIKEIESGELIVLKNFKHLPTDSITIIYNSNNNNPYLLEFIKELKSTIKKTNS